MNKYYSLFSPYFYSYCLTVNKSQGQTLNIIGFYLKNPVFLHGALYTALSRIGNPFNSHLKIYLGESYPQGYNLDLNLYLTINIVFQGLLIQYQTGNYINPSKERFNLPNYLH